MSFIYSSPLPRQPLFLVCIFPERPRRLVYMCIYVRLFSSSSCRYLDLFPLHYPQHWLIFWGDSFFKGQLCGTLWLDLNFINCLLMTFKLFPKFCYTNNALLNSLIVVFCTCELYWFLPVLYLPRIFRILFFLSSGLRALLVCKNEQLRLKFT